MTDMDASGCWCLHMYTRLQDVTSQKTNFYVTCCFFLICENFFIVLTIHYFGFTILLPPVRRYFWHLLSVYDILMLVGLANPCGADFYASTRPASS
jgi:hypothetical protein